MKICEEFLKEMNIENIPKLERAIACEMLKLVITAPSNRKRYNSFIKDDNFYFTDDILEDSTLVSIINISGYWSNDIEDVLKNALKDKNIDSPLVEKGYNAIFAFLDKKLEDK